MSVHDHPQVSGEEETAQEPEWARKSCIKTPPGFQKTW